MSRLPFDRTARSHLATALRDCHAATVAPYWNRIRAFLADELATQTRALTHGGLGHVLAAMTPEVRWRSPTLEVSRRCSQRISDIHLDGRGVMLVPSVFCRDAHVFTPTSDPDQAMVLFYPAVRSFADVSRLWTRDDRSSQPTLADLLGVTRGRALHVVANGCTTTELAERLHVSMGTASYHAGVLRRAGLITTRRSGPSVCHAITPLGAALLNGRL